MTELGELAGQYGSALQEYLSGAEELALRQAYELGRQALGSGLGIMDIAAIHREALAQAVLHTRLPEEGGRVARQAMDFFLESAAAFEMVNRGFQEASGTLHRVNEALEQEIVERRHVEEEIRKLNAELEARVVARTTELQSAKEAAQRELVERERAEQERERLFAQAQDYAGRLKAANERLEQQAETLAAQNDDLRVARLAALNLMEDAREAQQQAQASAEQLGTVNEQLREQAEELEVTMEELSAQNDELRAVRQQIEMERQRYQELFDFAPGGYLVTDENGTIREANRAAAQMLNVRADRLEGKPLTVFVDEQEHKAFSAQLTQLKQAQEIHQWEMHLQPREGVAFPALVDGAPTRDAQGQLAGLRWLLRDITERKQAEQALEASEERARDQAAQLQAVLDAAPAIIWTAHDCECRSITGNRASQELLRVPEGANVSKSGPEPERLAHYRVFKDGVELAPQDMPIQRTAASGRGFNNYAMDIVFDDGSVRSLLGNATPLLDSAGQPNGAIAAFMDITERKQAEQERERLLAENSQQRELLETLFEADPDALAVVTGEELAIQMANPAYRAISPRPTDDPVGQRWEAVWAGAVGRETLSAIRRVMVTGEPADEESQKRIYSDGQTRYFSFHARRLLWNAEYAALIVLQETTAIEQARQEAQRRAAELDAVITSIADGVMLHDTAGDIVRMNPAAERIMGYSLEERRLPLPERTTEVMQFTRADGQPITDAQDMPVPRALRGEIVSSSVMKLQHRRGDRFAWVSLSAGPIRMPGGAMLGAVSTLTDITELRQTQERLEQSNERLQAQTEELEVQTEELQLTTQELIHARDELEQRVRERTVELAQANAELRLASAYNRSLIEAGLDPLVTIGLDGKITDVNSATEYITGCPRAELIGTDFSDNFTEPEKARAGYQQAFREGAVYDYELAVRHRNGSMTPVLYNASVYRDEAGQVAGVFAAARDITERKRVEQEIARSLAAERKAREVAEILREASESLSHALDLDDVLSNLLHYLGRLIPYDSANVMLLENGVQLRVAALRGYERWADIDAARSITFDLRTAPVLNELVATQKSALIADTRSHPGWIRPAGAEHVVSWLGVPVVAGGEVIGLYSVDKAEPEFFTEEHRRLAEGLAGQAAVAIQNARLLDQIKRANAELEQRVGERTRELATLLDLSHNLASTLELDPLLGLILDQLKQLVDYTGAALLMLEGEYLTIVEYRGSTPRDEVLSTRFPAMQVVEWRDVIEHREPFIIADLEDDSPQARAYRESASEEQKRFVGDARSWMGIPMMVRGQVIGALRLSHAEPDYFAPQHVRLATAIANQAAVAIENARLYEQAQELAAVEERQRLARELHDSVSQAFYGISLGTHTALTLLDTNRAKVVEALSYVLSLTDAGLTEMRALIFDLRPDSLEVEGLTVALARQMAAIRARHGIEVGGELCDEPQAPIKIKEAIYRIAQEALTNAVKHARATKLNLWLRRAGENIMLEVQDDGVGFDPMGSYPGHLGLHSMRERVARLGGTLDIQSAPGRGTHISARFSL